jgi:hypothetical protein
VYVFYSFQLFFISASAVKIQNSDDDGREGVKEKDLMSFVIKSREGILRAKNDKCFDTQLMNEVNRNVSCETLNSTQLSSSSRKT